MLQVTESKVEPLDQISKTEATKEKAEAAPRVEIKAAPRVKEDNSVKDITDQMEKQTVKFLLFWKKLIACHKYQVLIAC